MATQEKEPKDRHAPCQTRHVQIWCRKTSLTLPSQSLHQQDWCTVCTWARVNKSVTRNGHLHGGQSGNNCDGTDEWVRIRYKKSCCMAQLVRPCGWCSRPGKCLTAVRPLTPQFGSGITLAVLTPELENTNARSEVDGHEASLTAAMIESTMVEEDTPAGEECRVRSGRAEGRAGRCSRHAHVLSTGSLRKPCTTWPLTVGVAASGGGGQGAGLRRLSLRRGAAAPGVCVGAVQCAHVDGQHLDTGGRQLSSHALKGDVGGHGGRHIRPAGADGVVALQRGQCPIVSGCMSPSIRGECKKQAEGQLRSSMHCGWQQQPLSRPGWRATSGGAWRC